MTWLPLVRIEGIIRPRAGLQSSLSSGVMRGVPLLLSDLTLALPCSGNHGSRWALPDRFGGRPDSFEAVVVSADHVTVFRLTEAEHGRVSRRDAIGMLINE